jgi:hypothetical protein
LWFEYSFRRTGQNSTGKKNIFDHNGAGTQGRIMNLVLRKSEAWDCEKVVKSLEATMGANRFRLGAAIFSEIHG